MSDLPLVTFTDRNCPWCG